MINAILSTSIEHHLYVIGNSETPPYLLLNILPYNMKLIVLLLLTVERRKHTY